MDLHYNYIKLFILLIITLYIIYIIDSRFSEFCSVKSTIDNRYYTVRKSHDSQASADTLAKINNKMQELIQFLKNKPSNAPFDKDLIRLVERFDPNSISESSNESELTSFTVNKGKKISFCLRCRDCSSKKLEPFNTLMFVAIHEMAHIMNDLEGHGMKFQRLNNFLLKNAIDCNIWSYRNYTETPVEYCNTTIDMVPI